MKKILLIVLVLLVAAGAAAMGYYWYTSSGPAVTFKTAKVEKGDLSATISATGTLEPEEVVDVGAQVQGIISRFGRDPQANNDASTEAAVGTLGLAGIANDPNIPFKAVDWNTTVTPHMLLAEIDPKVYQAGVDNADANVKNAQANIDVNEAKYAQADRDWSRAKQLAQTRGAIADADYDMYRANYDTTKAGRAVAVAALAQAKANLELAKINLDYTKIWSPVNGVIVDRRVNAGQTVVASLNAPSLFLIAKDLSRMQIWGSVNEADIGQIKDGQAVTFTVDAYPNKVYKGTVEQVRLNAQMTQQVVTYTVVVDFNNSNYKLNPYLTANILFEVDKRHDALLVPNAALRWQPAPGQITPDVRTQYLHNAQVKAAGGAPPTDEKDTQHRGMVWVLDGAFVRPVKVKIGLNDGTNTEVTGVIKDKDGVYGDMPEGATVVTGTQVKAASDDTNNPFQTKLFQSKKQ